MKKLIILFMAGILFSQVTIVSVAKNDTVHVAAGYKKISGITYGYLAISYDSINWIEQYSMEQRGDRYYFATWLGGRFFATGTGGNGFSLIAFGDTSARTWQRSNVPQIPACGEFLATGVAIKEIRMIDQDPDIKYMATGTITYWGTNNPCKSRDVYYYSMDSWSLLYWVEYDGKDWGSGTTIAEKRVAKIKVSSFGNKNYDILGRVVRDGRASNIYLRLKKKVIKLK